MSPRLSPEIEWIAAAAPAYLDRYGEPLHPKDLEQRYPRGHFVLESVLLG